MGVGKDISVNCLLGLPFLKGAKSTVDLEAGCSCAPVFRDFVGWTLLYRRPALTVPACNVTHIDTTKSNRRHDGVAMEMLDLVEQLSPEASNLEDLRQVFLCTCDRHFWPTLSSPR